jgi:hypothetical protein
VDAIRIYVQKNIIRRPLLVYSIAESETERGERKEKGWIMKEISKIKSKRREETERVKFP